MNSGAARANFDYCGFFYFAFQAEDLRDLESGENQGHRKELAPLLEPLEPKDVPGHKTSFINELKLSDFRQVLVRNGISSEFVGGVLWCCNGTLALRRVRDFSHGKFSSCTYYIFIDRTNQEK